MACFLKLIAGFFLLLVAALLILAWIKEGETDSQHTGLHTPFMAEAHYYGKDSTQT